MKNFGKLTHSLTRVAFSSCAILLLLTQTVQPYGLPSTLSNQNDSLQIAVTQVMTSAISGALSRTVTGATNAAAFNTAIDALYTALATAETTPTNGNIVAAKNALDTAEAVDLSTGTITSGFSYQVIGACLTQLEIALNNWLTFYPA